MARHNFPGRTGWTAFLLLTTGLHFGGCGGDGGDGDDPGPGSQSYDNRSLHGAWILSNGTEVDYLEFDGNGIVTDASQLRITGRGAYAVEPNGRFSASIPAATGAIEIIGTLQGPAGAPTGASLTRGGSTLSPVPLRSSGGSRGVITLRRALTGEASPLEFTADAEGVIISVSESSTASAARSQRADSLAGFGLGDAELSMGRICGADDGKVVLSLRMEGEGGLNRFRIQGDMEGQQIQGRYEALVGNELVVGKAVGSVDGRDRPEEKFYSPINGHWYSFHADAMTWADAQADAQAAGGHLVTIDLPEENSWISETFASELGEHIFTFLGGYHTAGTGAWAWVTGEAWSYREWYPGEPSGVDSHGAQETCLAFHPERGAHGYYWNDVRADVPSTFIVEFDSAKSCLRIPFLVDFSTSGHCNLDGWVQWDPESLIVCDPAEGGALTDEHEAPSPHGFIGHCVSPVDTIPVTIRMRARAKENLQGGDRADYSHIQIGASGHVNYYYLVYGMESGSTETVLVQFGWREHVNAGAAMGELVRAEVPWDGAYHDVEAVRDAAGLWKVLVDGEVVGEATDTRYTLFEDLVLGMNNRGAYVSEIEVGLRGQVEEPAPDFGTYYLNAWGDPYWEMVFSENQGQATASFKSPKLSVNASGTLFGNKASLTLADVDVTVELTFSADRRTVTGESLIGGESPATITGSKDKPAVLDGSLPQFTAAHIELAKAAKVSMFRACIGSDYSDSFESCCNMRHFFDFKGGVAPLGVKLYAPFDGLITGLSEEEVGTKVCMTSIQYPAVHFILWAVNLKSDLGVGDSISAGQQIGTHGSTETNSAAAVVVMTSQGYSLVSCLDVMSATTFGQVQKCGVASRADFIVSAAEREAHPCSCSEDGISGPQDEVLLSCQ